ncbi:MAG: plastocyanin/azurin family copper-binding protein [Chloroflexota bacterium]
MITARPWFHFVALAIVIALTAIIVAMAWRSASAATVSVDAGSNYFCSLDFDGSTCETDILQGDTVTWNVSAGTHTVTECNDTLTACPPTGGWDSGLLDEGQSYSQTFDTAGTFNYRCELHPSEMNGKIVVAAVATGTPSPPPSASASPTAASSATPAALPQTGGSGGTGTIWTLIDALSATFLAMAAMAFVAARERA